MNYGEFIRNKAKFRDDAGFEPMDVPPFLLDFQRYLFEWSCRKGRSATFADCGLGKTVMQLAWADQVYRHSGKPVLILAPLAVVPQTVEEALRFGFDAGRDKCDNPIKVTNYQRLSWFDPSSFAGIVCDESSILKSYSGSLRTAIIDFMKGVKYRSLYSATPSPNDFMELGNSVEALGLMRRVEMLATYFVHDGGDTGKWRLRGHAHDPFWGFVASWARAVRRPSDLGFDDTRFILPELRTHEHLLDSKPQQGFLFPVEATTLDSQRAERKATLSERCEAVAEIANRNKQPFVAWCSLNDESKMLGKLIDGAEEVNGSMSEEQKEELFENFRHGNIRAIVTKPSMAAFGMNWQHCNAMSFFPSHSHEQYYQALRRCWRFGQVNPVDVHVVTTTSESAVMQNLKRKEEQATEMFARIVDNMKAYYKQADNNYYPSQKASVPSWLNV